MALTYVMLAILGVVAVVGGYFFGRNSQPLPLVPMRRERHPRRLAFTPLVPTALERSWRKGDALTLLEIKLMSRNECPDCGGTLRTDRCGGVTMVISCNGCTSTFAIVGPGWYGERTSDAHSFAPHEAKSYREPPGPV